MAPPQVIMFAQGTPRDDDALLQFRAAVSPFALAMVSERSIEGRHAQNKRALAQSPHYSAALCSLALRSQHLHALLRKKPSALEDIIALFNKCRGAKSVLRVLGLDKHPAAERRGSATASNYFNLQSLSSRVSSQVSGALYVDGEPLELEPGNPVQPPQQQRQEDLLLANVLDSVIRLGGHLLLVFKIEHLQPSVLKKAQTAMAQHFSARDVVITIFPKHTS